MIVNDLTVTKFTVFGLSVDTVLHNDAWVAALLGTHLGSRTIIIGQIFMADLSDSHS